MRKDEDLSSEAGDDPTKDKAQNAKKLSLPGRADGCQGRQYAGSYGCGEIGPGQRNVKDVAEHGRDGSAENVAQMLRIGEGVGDEDAHRVRRILKWFECG